MRERWCCGIQIEYIKALRSAIEAEFAKGAPLTDSAKRAIKAGIVARCRDWPLESLIDVNIDTVAAELSTQR